MNNELTVKILIRDGKATAVAEFTELMLMTLPKKEAQEILYNRIMDMFRHIKEFKNFPNGWILCDG